MSEKWWNIGQLVTGVTIDYFTTRCAECKINRIKHSCISNTSSGII